MSKTCGHWQCAHVGGCFVQADLEDAEEERLAKKRREEETLAYEAKLRQEGRDQEAVKWREIVERLVENVEADAKAQGVYVSPSYDTLRAIMDAKLALKGLD